MTTLGVNIDHIATIRQARHTSYPDIVQAACASMRGGADQITVHLREDRRHIQDADLQRLKDVLTVPLNLEMAAVDEITDIACSLKPTVATLVPEKREELTTEGGLSVCGNAALRTVVERLKGAGIEVSLFIDPDRNELHASRELAVDAVEFHTGTYCDTPLGPKRDEELERLMTAVVEAHEMGLRVAAGHGLNYENIQAVVENIPLITEYNIGHAIVAEAVFVGMEDAVKKMKKLIVRR